MKQQKKIIRQRKNEKMKEQVEYEWIIKQMDIIEANNRKLFEYIKQQTKQTQKNTKSALCVEMYKRDTIEEGKGILLENIDSEEDIPTYEKS